MHILDYNKVNKVVKFTKLFFYIINIAMAILGFFFPQVLLTFVLNQAVLSLLWSAKIVRRKKGCPSNKEFKFIALLLTSAVLTVLAASLVIGLVANPLPFVIVISLVTLAFAIKTGAYFFDSLLQGICDTGYGMFSIAFQGSSREAVEEKMAKGVTEGKSCKGWYNAPVL